MDEVYERELLGISGGEPLTRTPETDMDNLTKKDIFFPDARDCRRWR